MKSLSLLVALFIVGAGVAGIVAPDRLLAIGQAVVTPGGLYAIGALRVGIGIVLLLAAPGARLPNTLRVLGAVSFVSGLATPPSGGWPASERQDTAPC